MLRRILMGSVSGFAVGAVIVVGVAQFAPETVLPSGAPESTEVAVPAGSEFTAELPDTQPVLPATEGRPGGAAAPAVSQPGTADAPVVDTSPAETPETGAPEGELASPSSGDAPKVEGTNEAAVETLPGTAQPAQPGVETAPERAEPLELPAVEGTPQQAIDAPQGDDMPEVGGEEAEVAGLSPAAPPSQPPVDATPTPGAPAVVPETSAVEEARDAPIGGDAPDLGSEEAEVAALAPAAPPSQPGVDARPASGDAPSALPETGVSDEAGETPQPVPSPTLLPDAPLGVGLEQPEIGALSPGIETDALPRIGAESEVAEDEPYEPALTKFATPFEASGETPLLSLVLIDAPDGPDTASFAEFPVPLTIAVDPILPGAGARMAAWRAVGIEVVVLTPLPEGAAPADVEVSFQSFLSAVPQAVAVMDLPEALLQESRPRAAQVVEILEETGHGMVTYDRGLNSGLQIAAGKGVHAASVFRVFDDGTRDVGAIKRFLDQGAFRAGQAGNAVMVGQLRDDTVAAITEWALGTRAATVSLSPVSAVLLSK